MPTQVVVTDVKDKKNKNLLLSPHPIVFVYESKLTFDSNQNYVNENIQTLNEDLKSKNVVRKMYIPSSYSEKLLHSLLVTSTESMYV